MRDVGCWVGGRGRQAELQAALKLLADGSARGEARGGGEGKCEGTCRGWRAASPHAGLAGEVGPHYDLFARTHVGVAVPSERSPPNSCNCWLVKCAARRCFFFEASRLLGAARERNPRLLLNLGAGVGATQCHPCLSRFPAWGLPPWAPPSPPTSAPGSHSWVPPVRMELYFHPQKGRPLLCSWPCSRVQGSGVGVPLIHEVRGWPGPLACLSRPNSNGGLRTLKVREDTDQHGNKISRLSGSQYRSVSSSSATP